jgi:NADH-quinone oxidoreductase subunit L
VGDFAFSLGIWWFMMTGAIDLTPYSRRRRRSPARPSIFSPDVDALTLICSLLSWAPWQVGAVPAAYPAARRHGGPTGVRADPRRHHGDGGVHGGAARRCSSSHRTPRPVTFIGATTAFFAATIGLVQNDIKRIIAYSTCSQLGYRSLRWGPALFDRHVPPVHPCLFKALLFLGSGSVILAMHHEQDIRHMGGLRHKIRSPTGR